MAQNIQFKKISQCFLCGSKKRVLKYKINSFKIKFQYKQCLKCGMFYMDPMVSRASVPKLYEKGYYTGEADYSYFDESKNKKVVIAARLSQVKNISKFVNLNNARLLDIGCSFGGFLEAVSKLYPSCDLYGTEISDFAYHHLKKNSKTKIFKGDINQTNFPPQFFDVITMLEVIEHLPSPRKDLGTVQKLLKPGGLLVIQTPNVGSLEARIKKGRFTNFLPGHLVLFSRKTLRQLLKRAGFKVKKLYYVDIDPLSYSKYKLFQKECKEPSRNLIEHYFRFICQLFQTLIGHINFGNFSIAGGMTCYATKS